MDKKTKIETVISDGKNNKMNSATETCTSVQIKYI